MLISLENMNVIEYLNHKWIIALLFPSFQISSEKWFETDETNTFLKRDMAIPIENATIHSNIKSDVESIGSVCVV